MECPQTYGNYDDGQATVEDETLFSPSPSTQRYENQESQPSTPTDTQEPQEPQTSVNRAAEHSRPKPPPKKRMKRDNNFDIKILEALQEPEKDDDPDMHFWKGLQPLLKQLDTLEAMKFKHDVHGLLIRYIERANSKTGHGPEQICQPTPSYLIRARNKSIHDIQPSPTFSNASSHAEYEQYHPNSLTYEDQYYTQS